MQLSEPNSRRRNALASAASLLFGLSQGIPSAVTALLFWYAGRRFADGSGDLAVVRIQHQLSPVVST